MNRFNSGYRLAVSLLTFVLIVIMTAGCSDDEECNCPTASCPDLIFEGEYGWVCGTSEDCQDVFEIDFKANSLVTFAATDVSTGSIVQVALYAPGVALGGTNLLTGSTNEYRCGYISGTCSENEHGQLINDFLIPSAGTYRFAVTRDWGNSCGSDGTYKLMVISDREFTVESQIVDDEPSQASGSECP